MARITAQQNSFTGGEWSPSLYARSDLSKYYNACKTMKNFIVLPHGGVVNRPGTEFVADCESIRRWPNWPTVDRYESRIIPFQYSVTQSYVLELTYTTSAVMRVIKDGALVSDSSSEVSVTAFSWGSSTVTLTAAGHSAVVGDFIYVADLDGDAGVEDLNGHYWEVYQINGNDITIIAPDSSGSYTSGGTVRASYKVSIPWANADLFELKFTQKADTMYVTHPDYPPYKITRSADDSWTVSAVDFNPNPALSTPINFAVANGSPEYYYVITAVDSDDEESPPSAPNAGSFTGGATWIPPLAGDPTYYKIYRTQDEIDRSYSVASGNEVTPGRYGWLADIDGESTNWVGNKASNIPDMQEQPPTYYDPSEFIATSLNRIVSCNYVSTNSATVRLMTSSAHGFSTDDYIRLTGLRDGSLVSGPGEYIEVSNRNFQITTAVNSTTFLLQDEEADGGLGAGAIYQAFVASGNTSPEPFVKVFTSKFGAANKYPGVCAFYQQRMLYARTANQPQTIFGSRTALYDNFGIRHPILDDDAFEFTLDALQMNAIEWMVPLEHLIVGTAGSEWVVSPGSNSDVITPTSIKATVQSNWGSASLQPVVIGDSVLFLQYGGNVIRDLRYSLEADGYRGNNLTIFSTHLFDNHTIVDWAYQRKPYSVLWCVRDDGILLGMTYLKEHDIYAWHYHDLGGEVESIACVPDGDGNDDLYMVVKRLMSYRFGSTPNYTRFIEKMSIRLEDNDIDNSKFLDCNSTRYVYSSISDITDDSNHAQITTSSAHGFTNGDKVDIRNVEGATELNGNQYVVSDAAATTFKIKSSGSYVLYDDLTLYISGGEAAVVKLENESVFIAPHLLGETCNIIENGVASTEVTTSDASYHTLGNDASKITIGFGFTSDLETMDFVFPTQRSATIRDKYRRIPSISLLVDNSSNFQIGPSSDRLRTTDFGISDGETYTGEKDHPIHTGDGKSSSVFIRQSNPLPVSIAAIIPRIEVGGD